MKKLVLAAAYLSALLVAPHSAIAQANTGACYNIAEADAHTYCLALAHRDAGQCYTIRGADLRARCLAEVKR